MASVDEPEHTGAGDVLIKLPASKATPQDDVPF
jgi:hypothetical protein